MGKDELVQRSESEQYLPGLGPEPQESLSQGGVHTSGLQPNLSMTAPRAMGGQERAGWTGFPGTPRPQRLLGSGCWQREKGPRCPGLAN